MATNTSSSKKSQGRRKVQMVRMEKDSNRRVTFSKRRLGLFKKASELCTLCAVEAAIIIFSPGRKAFSFGYPSVETIVNHFLTSKVPSEKECSTQVQSSATIADLNKELTLLSKTLEMEKKRNEEIKKIKKSREQHHYWWDCDFEELTLEQLINLESSLQDLLKIVMYQANMLRMLEASNASQFPLINGNYPIVGRHEANGDALYNPNGGFSGN